MLFRLTERISVLYISMLRLTPVIMHTYLCAVWTKPKAIQGFLSSYWYWYLLGTLVGDLHILFTTYHPQIVTVTTISVPRKPAIHVEMLITSALLSPPVPVVSLEVAVEHTI